jgi:hypothetical protein
VVPGAELLEREEVRVEPPAPDDVAARGRDRDPAAPAEERAREEDRAADPLGHLAVDPVGIDRLRVDVSVFRPGPLADTSSERMSSTSVSMSRMRGTFSSVTGCSVTSAAATIGSAAFLLPEGRIVPERRCPPSTMKRTAFDMTCGEAGNGAAANNGQRPARPSRRARPAATTGPRAAQRRCGGAAPVRSLTPRGAAGTLAEPLPMPPCKCSSP